MTSVGLSLPVSAADGPIDPAALLAVARRADEAGFASLSCGDHLLWHTAIVDPFVTLGMLAGATDRISLMTGVALAPLRHPLWLAKQAASLDALSGGRLVLGLGAGGEAPAEFEAVGADRTARGRVTTETAELVGSLLDGRAEPSWGGLVLGPRPSRRVPLWFGGRAEPALRRAALLGDGWLGLLLSPRGLTVARDRLLELAAAGPDRPDDVRCGVQMFVCLDDAPGRARERAARFVRGHFGRDDDAVLDRIVAGPAGRVAEVVDALAGAGADLVQLHLVGGDPVAAVDALADALASRLPATPVRELGCDRPLPVGQSMDIVVR